LRWARNDQDFRQISTGAIVPTTETPGDSSEDVWTYSVSPRWHLSSDTMAYVRVASGYRPGGPNVILPGVPPSVDADKLTNYEAGIKTEFADGKALVNIAAFYVDWKAIQQIQPFGGTSALDNAGDAKTQGLEIESLFSPIAGLQLGANLSYTQAELKSNPAELDNKTGEQLPGVPEWTGSLTAAYSFQAFGGHDAHVGAGWRYVDERQTAVVTNSDDISYVLPQYDVVDLNAEMIFGAITARLFVKNLTDERAYIGGGVIVDGLNQPVRLDANVLQPRTVGLSLDVQF
jgi:iron complex outermembrane recepter protein